MQRMVIHKLEGIKVVIRVSFTVPGPASGKSAMPGSGAWAVGSTARAQRAACLGRWSSGTCSIRQRFAS